MNYRWAADKARELVKAIEQYEHDQWLSAEGTAPPNSGDWGAVERLFPVVERILDRLDPPLADQLRRHEPSTSGAANRALGFLESLEELETNLGPEGPQLAAGGFHNDVWGSAAPLWEHGHRREAVLAACRVVNALLEDKLGRRDISETQLVREAWSVNDPRSGAPRLRVASTDRDSDPDTWNSLHNGARAFGEGIFMRIRNVLDHGSLDLEIAEAEALECLASLSLFARWIDEAEVLSTQTADTD